MSKPTRLKSEAALELFRFATEQLVSALWPGLDRRAAATRAAIIQSCVLKSLVDRDDGPRQRTERNLPCQ